MSEDAYEQTGRRPPQGFTGAGEIIRPPNSTTPISLPYHGEVRIPCAHGQPPLSVTWEVDGGVGGDMTSTATPNSKVEKDYLYHTCTFTITTAHVPSSGKHYLVVYAIDHQNDQSTPARPFWT